MSNIIIAGAGMAGLLAANMLYRRKPKVVEVAPSLPNNHSAVLRFRSPMVGELVGVPFRRVRMMKCTVTESNPVADMLSYSLKTNGTLRSDRSLPLEPVFDDRWIAPPDLIARMAENADCEFGKSVSFGRMSSFGSDAIISTIPMPALVKALNYHQFNDIEFQSRPGCNILVSLKQCDAYATIYTPSSKYLFNRISITGNQLIIEISNFTSEGIGNFHVCVKEALHLLGLGSAWMMGEPVVKDQRYAKITPIDETARKRFMAWATDNYNIFSLGRFATWKPGLLLDDLIDDIHKIEKWIGGDRYAMRRDGR